MNDSPKCLDSDDGPLFTAMAGGDPALAREALAELYRRHAASLSAFLRRLGLGSADMDDILQDTFLQASRKASVFRGRSARAWLSRLAADRAVDLRRAERRRFRRERRAAKAESAGAGACGPEAPDLELEQALGTLPETWRTALQLRLGSGLTHREVARVLGVSLRTAKDWSARGRRALEERLTQVDQPRRRAQG